MIVEIFYSIAIRKKKKSVEYELTDNVDFIDRLSSMIIRVTHQ